MPGWSLGADHGPQAKQIAGWILEQAGIELPAEERASGLRVVA